MVREATPADAAEVAELIALLGHMVSADGVRERLFNAGLPTLVAVEGNTLVGMCGLHSMSAVHRNRPIGRITILAVAEAARGRGVGRILVEAAEEHLRAAGCGLIEVTSNDRLTEAHRFYEHIGYEATSKRFAKTI